MTFDILGVTPAQTGLCQVGEFCDDPRPCKALKVRVKLTYSNACGINQCCDTDLAEVWNGLTNEGNVARGGSITINVGGWDLDCGNFDVSLMQMKCISADGSPGATLIDYFAAYECEDCDA